MPWEKRNSMFKEHDRYVVIKFPGEIDKHGKIPLDVVPRKWLGIGPENEHVCLYPRVKHSQKVSGWSSAFIDTESDWIKYKVEVLQGAGVKHF